MRAILAVALMSLASSAHAARAIMEQLCANSNTIFVATQTVQVGIGNCAPAGGAVLDVTGAAQFGSTAKSTFSSTGNLTLAPSASITIPILSSNSLVGLNSSSATISLPQLGIGGIPIGNGVGLFPSTGTLTGTASEVAITNAAGKITLGGAGQTVTCGASQYLSAATYNHGIATGGSCTTAGVGDVTQSGTNNMTGTTTIKKGSGQLVLEGLTDTITGSTHTLSGTATCSGFSCDLLTLTPGDLGTNTISIAGLPANSHIQIEVSSASWTTGSGLGWNAQFNGNNGATAYYALALAINTTALSATGGAQGNCMITALAAQGGANAGSASDFTMDIWTTKNGHAAGQAHGNIINATHYNDGNTRYVQEVGSCTYTVVDATINQVTFFNTSGTNLHIGTLTVRLIQ